MKYLTPLLCLILSVCSTDALPAKGINFKVVDDHPFIHAILENDPLTVKCMLLEDPQLALLENGENSLTPLMLAACKYNCDILYILIASGAPIDAIDRYGNTALMYAVSNFSENGDVIQFFINHKADLNVLNEEEYTPLMLAASNGHTNSLQLLVQGGAKLELKGANDCTPLFVAAESGLVTSVKTLISLGANIEARDKWGMTPLMDAAFNNNSSIVTLLLKLGANSENVTTKPITITTKRWAYDMFPEKSTITTGSTALQIATQYKKSDAQHVLQNWKKK